MSAAPWRTCLVLYWVGVYLLFAILQGALVLLLVLGWDVVERILVAPGEHWHDCSNRPNLPAKKFCLFDLHKVNIK